MNLTTIKENEKVANLGSDRVPSKAEAFDIGSNLTMKNQSQLKGLARGPGIAKRLNTLVPI